MGGNRKIVEGNHHAARRSHQFLDPGHAQRPGQRFAYRRRFVVQRLNAGLPLTPLDNVRPLGQFGFDGPFRER